MIIINTSLRNIARQEARPQAGKHNEALGPISFAVFCTFSFFLKDGGVI